jgi:RNA polymerase sigma-70 factor (ECF subfamily)
MNKEAKQMSEKAIDQELVKQAQAGDTKAFEMLVTRYQQKVANIISRYVRDRDEVLDVAQEVFIKVYKALPRFRGDSAFYTWIYRIAINTSKNHLVARSRRIQNSDVEPEEAERYASALEMQNFDTPEAEYARQEIETAVTKAVDDLPEDLRSAIVMREVDGLSYEEIAKAMDCPIGTVRSRIFRARDAIDKALKPLLAEKPSRVTYVG